MTRPSVCRRSRCGAQRSEHGFSLLELLVVMAILALLMAVVGPRVVGSLGKARSQTASVQIANVKTALDMFLIDVGRYPTDDEGLAVLVQNPGNLPAWAGAYLDEATVPLDPWGQPYRYDLVEAEGRVKVYSLGADDAPGGTGDDADIGL